MKVALVAEWLDAWRGGAETSTLQFIHRLLDHGLELHLFTRSRPSPGPAMHVHTVSGASMSRTRRSVTFGHRVERLLRAGSFDVVHAISPCRGADIYQPRGGTVAESIERNIALRTNGAARSLKRYAGRLNLKQRYMLATERKLFGDPNGPLVVAISDYVVRQLKQHYSVPDHRIRKVYNGVDADAAGDEERARNRRTIREEFGIAGDDLLVLVVAHNFRLKGVERWLEAMSTLLRRGITDVRSLVIGKGDSERWHRLASRLGVCRHLTFVGPSDRVPAFRHAADVLVHPTYYDPCSRVVMEGLVAGLPCITTTFDGASEVIDHNRNGFILADPTDVDGLVAHIETLRNAEKRLHMSEAARAIGDSISMARHAREMIALYEERTAAGVARP